MPSYLPPPYATTDYPPAFLHPKYDGSVEYPPTYHSFQASIASDVDFDPYNHSKHSGLGQLHGNYQEHYAKQAVAVHQMGAPIIQPLQVDNRYISRDAAYHSRSHYQPASIPDAAMQDEKTVGGVSALLDYEMSQMCEFVVEMTVGLMRPPAYDQVLFRKWVLQVLNATRLPSATIILSLSYLAIRIDGTLADQTFFPTERSLYQMLTVALILGSKFLDDNTFQNRSWAEVSNISVKELNLDEMEWLESFDHRLHMSPDVPNGFVCWQSKWISFKIRSAMPVAPLPPVDNSVLRSRLDMQGIASSEHSRQYHAAAMSSVKLEPSSAHYGLAYSHSPFQGWYSQRAGLNGSPPSAANTGPNTPEYYSNPSAWSSARLPTARDTLLGYSSLPQATSDMAMYQSAYDSAAYGFTAPSLWCLHGTACQCNNCRHPQQRFGSLVMT